MPDGSKISASESKSESLSLKIQVLRVYIYYCLYCCAYRVREVEHGHVVGAVRALGKARRSEREARLASGLLFCVGGDGGGHGGVHRLAPPAAPPLSAARLLPVSRALQRFATFSPFGTSFLM
eukprot:1191974-Prorocentrum_minimum.AAC.5